MLPNFFVDEAAAFVSVPIYCYQACQPSWPC